MKKQERIEELKAQIAFEEKSIKNLKDKGVVDGDFLTMLEKQLEGRKRSLEWLINTAEWKDGKELKNQLENDIRLKFAELDKEEIIAEYFEGESPTDKEVVELMWDSAIRDCKDFWDGDWDCDSFSKATLATAGYEY